MKEIIAMILALFMLCTLWGCTGVDPNAPTQEQVRQVLLEQAEPQLALYRDLLSIADLQMDIVFEEFSVLKNSVLCTFRDRLVSPTLLEMMENKSLTLLHMQLIELFHVEYDSFQLEDYYVLRADLPYPAGWLTGAGVYDGAGHGGRFGGLRR